MKHKLTLLAASLVTTGAAVATWVMTSPVAQQAFYVKRGTPLH